MIINLFSIFDPSTSLNCSINWLAMCLCFIFIPIKFWTLPRRKNFFLKNIYSYIYKEFKPLIPKNPQIIIMCVILFIFIIFNNVPGLLPYIFTATSHISITLALAFPLWAGFIIHGWLFNTSNLLIHLIPNGTPVILIPFIVVIETIRNIIRPLTLAIRLAANIIAGHLLITLLTAATPVTPLLAIPFIISAQIALAILEVAVAFIQAYVFRVLITLYAAERVS